MSDPIYPDTIQNGPQISPIEHLKLFSADEWEKFTEEWLDCPQNKKDYLKIERLAGAGDMGCDLIASTADPNVWDNYQCKRYKSTLAPSDVWVEFGKIVYYSYKGEYSYPRRYFFVAPQGVGTSLANLLRSEVKLKQSLIDNWEKYCLSGITTTEKIGLQGDLLKHLETLDFSIFTYITPFEIVEGFRGSPYYTSRFGGGLPVRPRAPLPPADFQESEVVYIKKLLDAYSDYLGEDIHSLDELEDARVKAHLIDSRRDFFSAEALRLFSRDSLPEGEFERLQEEFLVGISDELREVHPDGYKKVREVIKTARALQITDHPLMPRVDQKDRGGICHQLANEKDEVTWVDNE